jgi:hypothetical protein
MKSLLIRKQKNAQTVAKIKGVDVCDPDRIPIATLIPPLKEVRGD